MVTEGIIFFNGLEIQWLELIIITVIITITIIIILKGGKNT